MSDGVGGGGLDSIDDPRRLLTAFFEHAPTAFQIFSADGPSVLVNQAFRDLFGSEPPADYNVLEDDIAKRQGFLGCSRPSASRRLSAAR